MILVLMGVTGSGKTTVGKVLAKELGWKFYDADDYHPASNIEKMHRGIPLTDEDRKPWLQTLTGLIDDAQGSWGECRPGLFGAQACLPGVPAASPRLDPLHLPVGLRGVDQGAARRPHGAFHEPRCWTASSRSWSPRTTRSGSM